MRQKTTKNYLSCLLSLLLLFAANSSAGQIESDKKQPPYFLNEISIGMGEFSTDELLDGVRPPESPTTSYKTTRRSGTYSMNYAYHLSQKTAIGACFAFEDDYGEWGYIYSNRIGFGTFKRRVYTLAAEATLTYPITSKFSYYLSFGLGLSYQNEICTIDEILYNSQYNNGVNNIGDNSEFDNSRLHPNIHISPAGFLLGGKYNLFAEISYGYRGLFRLGLMSRITSSTKKHN